MLRPVGPALRAEGPAARLAQELSLGVGERVEAEVLSDLGGGTHEIRLAGRILKVQAPQPLAIGVALLLSVRQASGSLVLEILGQRQVTTAPEASLSARLASIGAPRDEAHRDALAALLERGLPVDRRSLDLLVSIGEGFPVSPALARRAAAFLLSQGLEVSHESVADLLAAARGGGMARAVTLLGGTDLPEARTALGLLVENPWSVPGPERLLKALSTLEEGAARLLASDPRLAELDTQPASEARSRAEREAMEALPGLKLLREAATSLRSALQEEAGRLQMGRDGTRYAEGVFQPPGRETVPVPLKVFRREGGQDGARKGPMRVGVALDLSKIGRVGADLVSDAGRLAVTLKAERVETGDLMRFHQAELATALQTLGFEASVSVAMAPAGELESFSRGPLAIAAVPAPVVDLKA